MTRFTDPSTADPATFQPDLKVLQEICDTLAARVPCDISFMADGGRVVASSIAGRMGQIHEGARRIQAGEIDTLDVTAEMAAASEVMLEGCNQAVQLEGKRIGSIGIAAPLAQARDFVAIVQTCIQVMLREHLNNWQDQQRLAARADRADQALRESEQRLRDIAGYMFDSIWETDTEHRYTYISARLPDRLELNADQVMGRTRWACMAPFLVNPDAEAWRRHHADMDAHRDFKDFQYSICSPSGQVRHLRVSGMARFDDRGEFLGYRGAARDVTAEVEAIQALRESENRFKNILESSSDWIWMMDDTLRFTFLSERFFEIFRVPRDRVIGKTRAEFAGAEAIAAEPEKWRRHFDDLAAHRPFKEFEYCSRDASGERRWIKLSGAPLFSEDGRFAGYQGTGTDTTALQRAREQLLRNEKLAALGSLVAGVAHEINTPIGNAITAISTLRHECDGIQQQLANNRLTRSSLGQMLEGGHEVTELIQANLQRAAGLINSFREMVAETEPQQARHCRLAELLEEVIACFTDELNRRGIDLRLNCPQALEITTAPGVLYQILSNLIENSLEHGFHDQSGAIDIDVRTTGEGVTLDYRDDGVGMASADLSRIFDPFYTTARGSGRVGLGMYLVHNLVNQALHGRISVQSEPGGGMHFTIELPQSRA